MAKAVNIADVDGLPEPNGSIQICRELVILLRIARKHIYNVKVTRILTSNKLVRKRILSKNALTSSIGGIDNGSKSGSRTLYFKSLKLKLKGN